MGFTKRAHPELGYDQRTEHWFITGDNSFRIRKRLQDSGAQFYSDEKRWYFPNDMQAVKIAQVCDEVNWELREKHWRKPESEAGKKRMRAAKDWG